MCMKKKKPYKILNIVNFIVRRSAPSGADRVWGTAPLRL